MPGPLDEVVLGAYERAKARAAAAGEPEPSLGGFVDAQARAFEGRGDAAKGRVLRDYLAGKQAAELPSTAAASAQAHETAVLQDVRRLNPLAGVHGSRMSSGTATELEQARAEKEEAAGTGGRAPIGRDVSGPYSTVDPARMVDLLEAAGVKTEGLLEGDVRRRFYDTFGEQVPTDEAAKATAEHLWRRRASDVQAQEAEGAEKRGEPIQPLDFANGTADLARTYVRDVEAQRVARGAERAAAHPFVTALREGVLGPAMESGAAIGSLARKDRLSGGQVATALTGGDLQDTDAQAVIAHALDTPALNILRGGIRMAADAVPVGALARGVGAGLVALKVAAPVAQTLSTPLALGFWSGATSAGAPSERLAAGVEGATLGLVAGTVSPYVQKVLTALPSRAANGVSEALGFLAGDFVVKGGDLTAQDAIQSLVLGGALGAQHAKTPAEARLEAARAVVREAFQRAGAIQVTPDGRAILNPDFIKSPDELARSQPANAAQARALAENGGVPPKIEAPRRVLRGPRPPLALPQGELPREHLPRNPPPEEGAPARPPTQGEQTYAVPRAERVKARGVSDEALDAWTERAVKSGVGRQADLRLVLRQKFGIDAERAQAAVARLWAAQRIPAEVAQAHGVEVEGAPATQPREQYRPEESGYGEPFRVPQGRTAYERLVRRYNRTASESMGNASPRRVEEHLRNLDRLRGTMKAAWEGLSPKDREAALRRSRTGLDYEKGAPAEQPAAEGAPKPAAGAAPRPSPEGEAPAAPAAEAPAPRRRVLRAKGHEKAIQRAAGQRQELRRLEDERYRDVKTGVRNADAWEAAKAREVVAGRKVLRVDLGEFKALNDSQGHEAGDRALGKVGAHLRAAAAEVGIPERNLFRTGGDEFTVAAPAEQVDRLQEALARRGAVEEEGQKVHLDVGTGDTPEAADAASRAAKAARKKAMGIGARGESVSESAPPPAEEGGGAVTPPRSPTGGEREAAKPSGEPASPPAGAAAPPEGAKPAPPSPRRVLRSGRTKAQPAEPEAEANRQEALQRVQKRRLDLRLEEKRLNEGGHGLSRRQVLGTLKSIRSELGALDKEEADLRAGTHPAVKGGPRAVPQRSAEAVPVGAAPGDRPPVDGGARKPSPPQPEAGGKPPPEPASAPQPEAPKEADVRAGVPAVRPASDKAWRKYLDSAIKDLGEGEPGTFKRKIGRGEKQEEMESGGVRYGDWAIVPDSSYEPDTPLGEVRRWTVLHPASGLAAGSRLSRTNALEMIARLKAEGVTPTAKGGMSPEHAAAGKRVLAQMEGAYPIKGRPFTNVRTEPKIEGDTMTLDEGSIPDAPLKGYSSGQRSTPTLLVGDMARAGWKGTLEVVHEPLTVKSPREDVSSPRYLRWKDPGLGVELRIHPGALGLDAEALAKINRVEYDLDSLGVRRKKGGEEKAEFPDGDAFRRLVDSGAAEVVYHAPGSKAEGTMEAGDEHGSLLSPERLSELPAGLGDASAPDVLAEAPSRRTGFAMDLPPLTQGPTAEWKGKRVPAHRMIRALQRAIEGIPIRTGRMTPAERRRAAGYLKVGPEVIRLREANDLPTAAHEAAHAVEKIVFWNQQGKPNALPSMGGRVGSELDRLGRLLYGSTTPNAGYVREGFAEFVRGWMFGKPDVGRLAPDTLRWWEQTFAKENPRIFKRLTAAKDLAGQFMAQGRENLYGASVARGPIGGRGALRRAAKAFQTRMVEAGDAVNELSRAAETRLGRDLAPSEDPFALLTGLRLTHSARARYMVEHGMIDVAGNIRGGSLREAAAIAAESGKRRGWSRKETIDRFTLYLWGRRAIERIQRKGKNPGMSLADARALVKEYESPEFSLAAEKVHKWNRGLLDYAVSGGALSRTEANRILAGSTDYIPLQRAVDALDPVAASRAIQGGTPLRKFKGSGEAIRDPFAVMAENAEKMARWTHERMVADAIVGLSKVEGMGHYVEKVPREVEQKHVELDAIRRQLEQAGADLTGADPDAILSFFQPVVRPPNGKPLIAHRNQRTGKVSWYEVDPRLYEAIHGLDVTRLPKWIDATFGRAARGLRLGTTGLRATFSLVTNPIRDAFTGYLQSESRDNPAKYVAEHARAMANEALKAFGKENPYSDLFHRLGGEMAQPLGLDTRQTQRAVKELFAGKGWKGRTVRVLSTPIEHLRDFLQFPESATRTAELRRVADSVGYKPGGPVTLDQALQMLKAAKRVTVDFTAAGTWARSVNQVIPFFNASIQGARSFARSMRDRPLASVLKAFAARTLPTLALWNAHKDEDWYRDMEWREKFSHWWIPVGEHELIAVPRVYDWDNAFSILPEALADSLYRKDPEALRQALGNLFETSPLQYAPWSPTEGFRFGILGENPIAGELLEQGFNRDSFTGQKIVPEGQKDLPAREQVAPFTSGIARFVGDRLGWSPRRIDHALRGFTGGLTHDAADVADALGRLFTGKDPGIGFRGPSRGELKDLPVVGPALARRGGKEGIGSLAVDRLYDALGSAREREASKDDPETPQERQRRLTLEDAGKAVKWLRVLQGAASTQDERQAIQREIRSIARRAVAEAGKRRFAGEAKSAEARARAATTTPGQRTRILRTPR